MGSGRAGNRKKNDKPIIREPKRLAVSVGAAGGAVKSRQDLIAEQCEISFQLRVADTPFTKKGIKADLEKEGTVYVIKVIGTKVASLTAVRSAMVDTCARLGVRYSGEIVIDKNKLYARFTRIIR